MSYGASVDFGALLPGVGVFGGVRRFLALGNALVQRRHRFVLYHPDGTAPDWLPFRGETKVLATPGRGDRPGPPRSSEKVTPMDTAEQMR
jgi:hypothetical protein